MIDEAGEGGHGTIDKAALFEAVHALFEAAAEQQPLVVVVEDLHWADQSTRDLMSFLFTRPFSQPVALVASYRSDDLHRKHPLRAKVAEWSRLQTVHRMSLEPLDAAEVRELVACLGVGSGAILTDDEVDMVVERAEGNAFFVEELVGATAGSHDSHDRGLPADLAEVLLVRLDRLDETARQVVRAASVAGRRVTHELLAVATDLDDAALDESLRTAVERNILVASDRHYAFRHALLGEAVYDDLLPGERVRLHGRYAAAIADGRARGTAAELARHAKLAHDDETALKASVQAGHEAAQVGGPDEAAQHFERALRLLAGLGKSGEALVDRARLAVDAAEALTSSGHPERAAALLAEQLAGLPDDASPTIAWCAARRPRGGADRDRDRRGPARHLRRGRPAHPRGRQARARPGAGRPRPRAGDGLAAPGGPAGRPRRARPRRPAQPHRPRRRGDHHPERVAARHHQGAAARGAARGHRPHGRDRRGARRAARPLPPGPLLPGLGRARRGRALVPQRRRARRGQPASSGPPTPRAPAGTSPGCC